MLRVLLAGGGTGGHINPALAIAGIIKEHRPDAEFLFAGTPNGMEARLVPEAGYKLETIKVAGFQRKLTIKNIGRNVKALWYLAGSSPRAKKIIKDFKPDLAIGTGGYVSGPVIRMAAKMGIPSVIHEQNAYPGVTNKMLAKEVSHIMLTVKEAEKYFQTDSPLTVTGLPVRGSINNSISKAEARKKLGLDDAVTVLSFGGSLGAGCINDVMSKIIINDIKKGKKVNHIHGYGKMGRESVPEAFKNASLEMTGDRYRVSEYINDMAVCLSAADLCVCRAGAATLAELEAAGKPSILIPSPIVAGNHQFYNAKVLSDAGAAVLIEQKDVVFDDIENIIDGFVRNPERLEVMSEKCKALFPTDTNERVWKVIESVIKK